MLYFTVQTINTYQKDCPEGFVVVAFAVVAAVPSFVAAAAVAAAAVAAFA